MNVGYLGVAFTRALVLVPMSRSSWWRAVQWVLGIAVVGIGVAVFLGYRKRHA